MKPFVGCKVRLYAQGGVTGRLINRYPDTFFPVTESKGFTLKVRDPDRKHWTVPRKCVTQVKGYTSVFVSMSEITR